MATTEVTRVKYRAVVMAGSVLLEIRVPLEPTGLSQQQITELNAAFAAAAQLVTLARDGIAGQLRSRGICPWCGELRGPEGHNLECLDAT